MHPEVRDWSGAHLEVWEWLGVPPESLGGAGSPPGGPGGVRRPTWRSGRVWEARPEVLDVSGVSHRGLGGVGSHTPRSRRGQEAHQTGLITSESPLEGQRVVQRTTQVVQEAHTEVWEGSGDPHGGLEGPPEGLGRVRRHTRRSRRGRETHPEVRKFYPEVCEGPEGFGRPYRRAARS